MKRRIEKQLLEWKSSPQRKPLLILGARQVGKTYSAEQFGKQYFKHSLTVNFQTDLQRLTRIFEQDLKPTRIIRELGLLYETEIDSHNTLLLLDEIQLCQPAITCLKYFAEQLPELPIIATGSLFGITVHRQEQFSFPVGKVDILHLFPMDFEEFLWSLGKDAWAAGIRECYHKNRPFVAHQEVSLLYRQYLMCGGLPDIVARFKGGTDWNAIRAAQRNLAALYTADIIIYLNDVDGTRAKAVWDSVSRQLSRESSRKFKLSDIKSGARAHQYEEPLAWLKNAGLIHRHYLVESPQQPLIPRSGGSFYKVYLLDVGLLSSLMQVRPAVFIDDDGYRQMSAGFRGGIAECYVKQSLAAKGIESFYWSSGNMAEIDFLFQDDSMNVVPLEVKSGDNVQSKSLGVYRKAYAPEYAIRLSMLGFGYEKGLKSVPLYAAFCL